MKTFILMLAINVLGIIPMSAQNRVEQNEYDANLAAPTEFACNSYDKCVVLKSEATLGDGRTLIWSFSYAPSEKKIGSLLFTKPDSIEQSLFERELHAMATVTFWKKLLECLQTAPNECNTCIQTQINNHIQIHIHH